MLPKLLQWGWTLLLLTPLTHLVTEGFGTLSAASVGIYGLGWLLLRRALSRDADCTELRAFAASPAALAGLVLFVAWVQLLAFVLTTRDLSVLVLIGLVSVLAFWAVLPSAAAMRRVGMSVVTLAAAFSFAVVAAELVCRLPIVVARTGGTIAAKKRWADEHYDFVWKENIYGERSFHLESPQDPATLRVLAIGDSYTWGDKIPDTADSWPYVLERALQETGRQAEVINLGRKGHTTVNEAEALRRIGWLFEPDLVVLQYSINDPLPSGPDFAHENPDWLYRIKRLSPIGHRQLADRSYLYALLDDRFRQLQIELFHPDGYGPLYDDDFSGWIETRAALVDMAEQVRGRRVPMLVVLIPRLLDLRPGHYPYERLHGKVAEAVARAELPLLDLWPELAARESDGRGWWALPWDAHPGHEAHRLIGEAVARELEVRGLLPSGSESAGMAHSPDRN